MAKQTAFTVELDTELRDQFMSEAAAVERPASELVSELMRDFIERQRQARKHDAWFRAEVEQGLQEADDPSVELVDHEEVEEGWRRKRAEWAKKIEGRAG